VELVDLAKDKIPSVSAGVWATQSYLDAHRDVVQKVVDSVIEALQREKSDRAYAESEISKHLGIKDKGELDFTYNFYVKSILASEPMPEAEQIASNRDALSAGNPKLKTIDVNAMIDQSFVENARKGLKP
jgi:ABC-type nitrate/sulfonate/bicarbonate transport system substrate-binding protein